MGPGPPSGTDRYRFLVEELPQAVTLHTADGRYLYVAPAFEELTGLAASGLEGSSAYEIIHPEDIEDVWAVHETLITETTAPPVRYRLLHAEGHAVWVETLCRSTLEGDTPVILCATRRLATSDTAVREDEEQRQALRGLRTLAEERQAFLTAIAHRARIPMTAILGFSHLLRDRLDDLSGDQLRRAIERLRVNAERMARLIEEVTEAESLRNRTVRADRRPVDVAAVVAEVVDEVVDEPSPVEVELPDATTLQFADEARLRLLVRALLLNALGHTPSGTPVMVALTRDREGLRLCVEDAGPGVPDELKARLFEPFVSGTPDDPDPGIGLGLYVVAEVAALHGGRAWVEDRPGGGTRFLVTLPGTASMPRRWPERPHR